MCSKDVLSLPSEIPKPLSQDFQDFDIKTVLCSDEDDVTFRDSVRMKFSSCRTPLST